MSVKNRSSKLEIGKILEILPHRYPFVLVDRVTLIEPGKRITGHKMVSYNEPWCGRADHQALARSGILACASTVRRTNSLMLPGHRRQFATVARRSARPRVSVVHHPQRGLAAGEASVEGTLCTQATARFDRRSRVEPWPSC
jgi:hypothetical protein